MKIVALAGGVGGAKLVDGLAQALPASDLTAIVNTGDDFEHLGLRISPDLDTVCYTLAGIANPETGWGRRDESFHTLQALADAGQATWFRLGDKDLATHILRTARLKDGARLSQVTRELCQAWQVLPRVLPMSDDAVCTKVLTREHDRLDFQEYFVRLRCEPQVTGFEFVGLEQALPAPGVLEALRESDAIVICPSNPWVSIDPILAVPGLRSALSGKPVVAVSPLIGGKTVKGPAAKIFSELGFQPSSRSVAEHYAPLLSAFVLDRLDQEAGPPAPIPLLWTDILMKNRSDRLRLAEDVLNLIRSL